MEETLTLARLGIGAKLKTTLQSTNPIASMIEIVRRTSRNIKRRQSGDMCLSRCRAIPKARTARLDPGADLWSSMKTARAAHPPRPPERPGGAPRSPGQPSQARRAARRASIGTPASSRPKKASSVLPARYLR